MIARLKPALGTLLAGLVIILALASRGGGEKQGQDDDQSC
jgi:hypothetical protein